MVEITKGNLFVVSGPSGVGKSTICAEVIKRMDNVHLSVSATTRPIGKGEVDGQNYFYLSQEQFKGMIRNNEFLEYAEVFGNFYGTPWQPVKESIDRGESIILEIDVQGGMSVKKVYDEVVLIFVVAPTTEDVKQRLSGRARGEDEETERKRMELAEKEIAVANEHYDHIVVNDDLKRAVQEVMCIIKSNSGENE